MALSILIYYLFTFMYVYMLIYVCQVHAGVHGSQKRAPEFPGLEQCSQLWSHFSSPRPLFLFIAFLCVLFPLGSLSHRVGLGDGMQVLGLAASTFMGRALSLAQISSMFIKHLLSRSGGRLGNLVCFCHSVASECFSHSLA